MTHRLQIIHCGQPIILMFNPGVSPKTGCLNTVWTGEGCNLRWSFWQYSQTGPGGTFGVSSRGIDLNVFAGSAEELLALAGFPAAT